jgi:F420-dependent oxidoreductase-like protein
VPAQYGEHPLVRLDRDDARSQLRQRSRQLAGAGAGLDDRSRGFAGEPAGSVERVVGPRALVLRRICAERERAGGAIRHPGCCTRAGRYGAAMRIQIRLGLQIPNFDLPGVAPDKLFERLAAAAGAAEDAGFDSVFVMDHLHQIPPMGPPTNSMLEGTTLLAGLAARTSRVSLGLLVGGVGYRNPALLAKIATTIDAISAGRALLGIGAGWFEAEHAAYGYEFPPIAERFERLEEALQIARAMFTQEAATFEGEHYRVAGALNVPRPIRGDIPILVGGSGERKTLRLVARYADASNVFGDVEQVRHLMEVLAGHCEAAGRDPAEIAKTRLGTLCIARTHDEAVAKAKLLEQRAGAPELLRPPTLGTPDEVAEEAQAFLDAGLDGLIYNMPDVEDLDAVGLAGETLRKVVGA